MAIAFVMILAGLNFLYYAEKKLELGILDWPYTKFVAWSSAQVGALILPYPVSHIGTAIIADQRTTVFIASGCNGLEAIFLMVAAVLAYPATWSRRWRALATYVALLYALNLLRVVFLTHVAHTHPEYLDVAHYQIAQGILVVFVLFFWIHYVRRTDLQ